MWNEEGRERKNEWAICRHVVLPDLGLGDVPISVSVWLVKRGERVAEGEPLVEVMAGPATVDLPSPADGVLVQKLVGEGETIAVGQRLAAIECDD
ncbi:MAG: lipoyl domain-containing protein [Planctomycetaceae bacterium]|nr:lipoyl domain-containing protein [Planctomycetaceae bacterium]